MATFVKRWGGSKTDPGGLFGSRMVEGQEVLGWSRAQQAAFLIFAWEQLRLAIKKSKEPWAEKLRIAALKPDEPRPTDDAAFYGPYSLLVTDQGVRGFLHVLNDLCFVWATKLKLQTWQVNQQRGASDANAVSLALETLRKHPVATFVKDIAAELADFDWRTSGTPRLTEGERSAKLVYRGSSGYKELRAHLIKKLKSGKGSVADAAKRL
ncbi:hypothetical protein CRBSH125_26390 [Afipia carboxidovorans]|nr:hypothetical protein CRBSH125_26390 [Afipia carboxidovorans]